MASPIVVPGPEGSEDLKFSSGSKSLRALRGTVGGAAKYLPYLLQSLFGGTIQSAPALTQANLDLLLKYGPGFAAAEQAASRAGKEAEVGTDLELLQGKGGALTEEMLRLNKLVDPEFFGLRSAIGAKGQELIAGQDPNKLTEAELANVERGANRSAIGRGVAGSGSITANIGNALTFDTKLQQKRSNLLQTLTNLGGLAPGLRSGAFNFGAATGAGGAGAGMQQFSNTFDTAQQQAGQLANNLLGQSGSATSQRLGINAQKIPNWERVVGALPDYS